LEGFGETVITYDSKLEEYPHIFF